MLTVRFSPLSSLLAAMMVVASLVGSLPAAAQTVAPPQPAPPLVKAPAGATPRQQAWLRATPEQRVLLAELLGEDGARAFARKQGWQPILDGAAKAMRQGPDQVWRSADGVVHVVEAKGGSGQLGKAFGYQQGTPEWAVRSAQNVMNSPSATSAERSAAKAILEAASKGKLEVHVVRTSHALGEPIAATLERSLKCTDDAMNYARTTLQRSGRAAAGTIDDMARTAAATDDVARTAGTAAQGSASSSALRATARVAVPVAVVVDGGLRVRESVRIEERYIAGEISRQEREIEHARNAAGMVGGWSGALVGAKAGAIGGGAAGTAVAPGPGTAIGAGAGAVAGGVAGYVGGEAAAEAASGWAVKKVHDAGATVSDLAGTALEKASAAGSATADAASRTWGWTCQKTGAAWNATSGGAKCAWRWLAD